MKRISLRDYLAGIGAATTHRDLEAALQVQFAHPFHGPTWTRICNARIAAGEAICDASPLGQFVPRFKSRRLTVCGDTYRVARGGNSTGVRYAWHGAQGWAVAILRSHGFSRRAAHTIWEQWRRYPHRCLATIEKAMAGELPDPQLDVLIYHERGYGSPIRYSVKQNEATGRDRRASQKCRCGGTLFDWGSGHSYGLDFINWHCNACPDVATEYLSPGRLYEIRNGAGDPKCEAVPT